MRVSILNRVVVTAGIGAVALLGLSVPTYATPQQGQTKQEQQKNQQAQKKQDQAQAKEHHQAQVDQQQQRLTQYRDHLDQQQRHAQAQSAELQQQHRQAQYTVQQQYVARLHQQQLTVQRQAPATYGRDRYFSTPVSVRYFRGGQFYETNQYGVNLLRQAVNYGYDQGYRTGLADRHDRSTFNFEGSFAYQDANYGYTGFYVDQDNYNHYFREGFHRGYEDGYGGHSQYGTYVSGRGTILGAVLGTVLNFQVIVR
jgi:flagellar motor protein MotB